MKQALRRAGFGFAAAAALLLAVPTSLYAAIPPGNRIVREIAKVNRSSGRVRPLRLSVELHVGPQVLGAAELKDAPRGRGEFVTHPQGLARLELRGGPELVERHLLVGSDHTASRNGRLLDRPRAFLPPLFLLQASSSVALGAAVQSLGGDPLAVGLAHCGDWDCFVLGDPARVPPPIATPEAEGDGAASEAEGGAASLLLPSVEAGPRPGSRATLWVDAASYDIRGMDAANGTRIRLGPVRSYGKVRMPGWISIEEPGLSPVRFEVLDATPVNAPAAAFQRTWLESDDTSPLESN